MSSPEAQQLEASVAAIQGHNNNNNSNYETNGNTNHNAWNSMKTQSAERGPRQGVERENNAVASQGLLMKKKKNNMGSSHKKKRAMANNTGNNNDDDDDDDDDDIYAQQEQHDTNQDDDDEFFDRPLWESRGGTTTTTTTAAERSLIKTIRFMQKIYKRLYGDKLPPQEMLRTLCLASTLFFMIGGYWTLRSLKDPIVTALCGVRAIPRAKMLSVFVVLAVVSIYNYLLDSEIPRHRLFYMFGTFYFLLFMTIALLLMHPTIGLANEQPNPWRILGWISYCSIESFGSVMVSLFWSFANSNFSLETAKASYGVMVALAQVGSILGPTFVNRFSKTIGVAKCYMLGALCMLLLQGTMYTYIRNYGAQERNVKQQQQQQQQQPVKKKEKAGVLEGLHLFVKYNYVKGIFAISCLFMVEVTIVDFTMKLLAKEYFADEFPCEPGMSCYSYNTEEEHGMSQEATAEFTAFMGFFGQATNTLSFLLSLLGTSAVIRFLGLRLTLLLFPTLCLCVIIFVRLYPTLYVVFGAMMTLKACSYALNNPTKEMLYQPTSAAVRYKAKSWIDIFGARGSKALGSLVTNFFSDSASHLVSNGSFVGMAVASFLIWNARFMGRKFDDYMSTGYVVGEEPAAGDHIIIDEDKNIEMASAQNEVEDTSCAIYEEDDANADDDDDDSGEGGQEETKAEVQMV